LHRPTPTLSPRRPAELLPILPHDRRRRLQPNTDAATLVDIGALGGNAPDDILGGQYRCHRATLTRRFATHAVMGVNLLLQRQSHPSVYCKPRRSITYLARRQQDEF